MIARKKILGCKAKYSWLTWFLLSKQSINNLRTSQNVNFHYPSKLGYTVSVRSNWTNHGFQQEWAKK